MILSYRFVLFSSVDFCFVVCYFCAAVLSNFVLISYYESIIRAVGIKLLNVEYRHCVNHIYASRNKSFKGEEMKLLFWRCAGFNDGITEMERVNPIAVEAFKLANPN